MDANRHLNTDVDHRLRVIVDGDISTIALPEEVVGLWRAGTQVQLQAIRRL